jgi:hypothetical protein
MAAKSLENLLNPCKGGDLASIVRRAQDMGDLASALARALPPEEGASIIAANVRDDGELVVLCQSPAWASRLRFSADALLAAARAEGAAASRCSVRVARGAG